MPTKKASPRRFVTLGITHMPEDARSENDSGVLQRDGRRVCARGLSETWRENGGAHVSGCAVLR